MPLGLPTIVACVPKMANDKVLVIFCFHMGFELSELYLHILCDPLSHLIGFDVVATYHRCPLSFIIQMDPQCAYGCRCHFSVI